MDEDLKTYLREMEERTATLIADKLRESEERTATLIADKLRESEERTATLIANEVRESENRTSAVFAVKLRESEDRTAVVISNEIGSLHNEIQDSAKLLGDRFDSIDARLKLQAGLIQSGARAMARFSGFSENSEERWVALLTRVEALERKVIGGERGNGAGKN